MKKKLLLTCAALYIASVAHAGEGVQWGYTGDISPEHWATLSPEFAACSGKNQSPINLTNFIEAELAPLTFAYQPGGNEIVNNGHSIQVNYAPGSSLSINGKTFELKQFHFHAPSENHIDGKSYPFENHLVHMDKDGNIAVVAVLYTEGEKNEALGEFWPQMPKKPGDPQKLTKKVDATALLPAQKDYYLFNGSLTTPPCTEGVLWIVFKEPVAIAPQQVKEFADIMTHPNNRPVQPVNARPVLK
ncbi:MAG: carbonic anhydrase [Desulfobulbus sp.]|jgi:carbonic anhydrase